MFEKVLHKEFALSELCFGIEFLNKKFSAPSAQKALVLLSYKKFSPRFARKEKEGGDRSKFCNFVLFWKHFYTMVLSSCILFSTKVAETRCFNVFKDATALCIIL